MSIEHLSSPLPLATMPPRSSGAPVITTAAPPQLGMAPAVSVIHGASLLLLSGAYNLARGGVSWAEAVYWVALGLLVIPVIARLLLASPTRGEQIGLITSLGLSLFLVKILHSPVGFTFYDEFSHWRATATLSQTGYLFTLNPLLPASTYFPGLHIVTSALQQLSGLEVFPAGVLVIGLARLLGTLALFLFFERVTGKSLSASLASVVYLCSPTYLFFHAQFGYESLALPLTALFLWVLVAREASTGPRYMLLSLMAVLVLGSVVVTHHLTSYLLAVFLLLWLAIDRAITLSRPAERRLRVTTFLLAVVLISSWLVYMATIIVGYLSPHVTRAVGDIVGFVRGDILARSLFSGHSGATAPLHDRFLGIGAIAMLLAFLPSGLKIIWRQQRTSSLWLAVGMASLFYPFSLALRFLPAGTEISHRFSGTLFIALAPVIALGLAQLREQRLAVGRVGVLLVVGLTIATLGGFSIGAGYRERLPSHYLVAADMRSIEDESIAGASWAQAELGPNHRIVADRTNRILMGTYGSQRVVSNLADNVPIVGIYYAQSLDGYVQKILREGAVEYVVIDWRLSTSLPMVAGYIEGREPIWDRNPVSPIERERLAKFEGASGVGRLYDSGNIVIYDVVALWQ